MAGSLQVRRLSIFGKRLASQLTSTTTPNSSLSAPLSTAWRRKVHLLVYDKNPDEHIHPPIIPDELIHAQSGGDYWAPHPKTGVFGPASDYNYLVSDSKAATKESVLEVKAFFRSLEDLDKPPYQF